MRQSLGIVFIIIGSLWAAGLLIRAVLVPMGGPEIAGTLVGLILATALIVGGTVRTRSRASSS